MVRMHGKCARCKKSVSKLTIYETRMEYHKIKGTNKVSITCGNCQNTEAHHLNDLKAVQSQFIGIEYGIAIIFAIITILGLGDYFWRNSPYQTYYIGMVAGVPVLICSIWSGQNLIKVKAFNQSWVKYDEDPFLEG